MDELVLGLDLCDGYTQLSCWGREESWTFPTVVCRKKEEDTWLIGEEAYARALMGDGIMVDKLLKMVLKDGTATIAGTKYCWDVFWKRCWLCRLRRNSRLAAW